MSHRYKSFTAFSNMAVLKEKKGTRKKGIWVGIKGKEMWVCIIAAQDRIMTYGPFPITHVISCTSYQLKLPSQWKIHNVFHATLLTPYKETPLNGKQYQEPIPELINGQPEWEVEAILCVRRHRNQLQYLVRWKGFSEVHDSWEPAKDVHTENLVEEFYKRHPTAIHTIHLPSNIYI
jgi:hypothetical protein